MTRKKVRVEYIVNDAARKSTFKKRKGGMLKKVGELSTLCDISACAVVCSPYAAQPEVWPNRAGAQQVIDEFRSLPEMEQTKKMVTQATFIQQSISKTNEHLRKLEKDYRQIQIAGVVDHYLSYERNTQGLKGPDFTIMGWIADQYLKKVNKWVDSMKQQQQPQPQPQQQQFALNPMAPPPYPPRAAAMVPGQMAPQPLPPMPPPSMGMDHGGPKPEWPSDWMNNPSNQQNLGFGNVSDGMILPFPSSSDWPSGFFPPGGL